MHGKAGTPLNKLGRQRHSKAATPLNQLQRKTSHHKLCSKCFTLMQLVDESCQVSIYRRACQNLSTSSRSSFSSFATYGEALALALLFVEALALALPAAPRAAFWALERSLKTLRTSASTCCAAFTSACAVAT